MPTNDRADWGAVGDSLSSTVRGWPLVGSLPAIIRSGAGFWSDLAAIHGDIYRLDLAGSRIVVLGHHTYARHVLVDNARNYLDKGGSAGFRRTVLTLTGQGLSTLDAQDEEWTERRKTIKTVFDHASLRAMADQMARLIDSELSRWIPSSSAAPVTLDVTPRIGATVMTSLTELLYMGPRSALRRASGYHGHSKRS